MKTKKFSHRPSGEMACDIVSYCFWAGNTEQTPQTLAWDGAPKCQAVVSLEDLELTDEVIQKVNMNQGYLVVKLCHLGLDPKGSLDSCHMVLKRKIKIKQRRL